jgi:hypothetical protein
MALNTAEGANLTLRSLDKHTAVFNLDGVEMS